MQMPGKDEIIKQVRHYLDETAKWVPAQHKKEGVEPCDPPCWTLPIKKALLKACQEAHRACNPDGQGQLRLYAEDRDDCPKKHNWLRQRLTYGALALGSEWHKWEWQLADGRRFDVVCTYKEAGRRNGLLVAESELGGKDQVLKELYKLRLARTEVGGAELRVLVFNLQSKIPFECLEKHIRQYHDNQPGDTYLLAAFTNGGLEYRQFDIDEAFQVIPR